MPWGQSPMASDVFEAFDRENKPPPIEYKKRDATANSAEASL
ncbi:MAG: hypothetical protein RSC51_07240 [Oscillospiraceae bacterium]